MAKIAKNKEITLTPQRFLPGSLLVSVTMEQAELGAFVCPRPLWDNQEYILEVAHLIARASGIKNRLTWKR